MSHIEFVYYDTVYNESIFTHTYSGPFVDKMEIELLNTQVPCDDEYSHITRVLGLLRLTTDIISQYFSAVRTDGDLLLRYVDSPDLHTDHSGADNNGRINDDIVGGGGA